MGRLPENIFYVSGTLTMDDSIKAYQQYAYATYLNSTSLSGKFFGDTLYFQYNVNMNSGLRREGKCIAIKGGPAPITKAYKTANQALQISPNPCKGLITLALCIPSAVSSAKWILYDVQGREVGKVLIPERGNIQKTISLEHLPSGLYYYKFSIANGQVYTGKLIKIE